MPGAPFDAFVGGFYRSQSVILDCETLQNWYVEVPKTPGAKSAKALYPTPGMQRFGSVSQVGGRAAFSTAASDSRMFTVTGGKVYEWFYDGSAIERGTVAVDGNPATICTNGDGGQQLAICSGTNYYVYDLLLNTLTQVAFLNGKATMAGFAGGYFLVFDLATGTVYQSDLYDGATFDPLNFFQRSVQADDWASMFVTSWGQIFLPGTKTRDYYYNSGTFPIPWAPAQSGIQTEGCAATFSVCECGPRIVWLGTTAQGGYRVYAASGYDATPISTEAIEYALSRYSQSEIAKATAAAYSDQGHDFYLLRLSDKTYAFDFDSGAWHTRVTFVNATTDELGPWRARFHCFAFNKHLWVDADTGSTYESDISFPLDVDGLEIQRQRTSPSLCFSNQMLDIGEFELKLECGLGNPNAPATDPQVMLEISYDGGQTWGRQRTASTGRIGQYTFRTRWQSNGSGRDVAFRITVSDPINNWRIIAAYLELFLENGQQVSLQQQAAA